MLTLDPIRKRASQFFKNRFPNLSNRRAGFSSGESMVLVIDRSGSMAGRCGRLTKLQAAQEAAIAMLQTRLKMGMADRLAVIAFNHEAKLAVPLMPVPEFKLLITQRLRLLTATGCTDLATGLDLILEQIPRPDHVIVLTDGQGGDPIWAADKLKSQGTIVETVGVGNTPQEVDESVLRRTASIWEGEVLYRFIRDGHEVIRYFQTQLATRLVKR